MACGSITLSSSLNGLLGVSTSIDWGVIHCTATERTTQAEIHRDLNSFASQVEACRVITFGLGMVNVVLDVKAVEGKMVVWQEGDETEE